MKTPNQIGQEILAVVNKASGSKKRHDALIIDATTLRSVTPNFSLSTFADYLGRKLKPDEGLIISHAAFAKLFGSTPAEFDMASLQGMLSKHDISLQPLYKRIHDTNVAAFIVIHRKLFRAIELADELREIITGQPLKNNRKAWLVGIAIKVSEELGQITQRTQSITKYDILDALNLLTGDEIYYISYNFLLLNKIDPRELTPYLNDKKFYVDKLLSDHLRDQESNPDYKELAEIAGLLVSRSMEGIQIGRANLDILFECSEQIDTQIQQLQVKHEMSKAVMQ